MKPPPHIGLPTFLEHALESYEDEGYKDWHEHAVAEFRTLMALVRAAEEACRRSDLQELHAALRMVPEAWRT